MGSRFIITTRCRADTSAARAWTLLADAHRWPQWWSAIAQVQSMQLPGAMPGNWSWRVVLGRPLRLVVSTLASQPPQWLTLRLHGDLLGQATITLQPASGRGLDITCRCELQTPRYALRPLALVFENRLRQLLRSLSTDVGRALHCEVQQLDSWQGRWQNAGEPD
jgi:uncharacterized protein YndB with AHSA1/START domain